MTPLPRLLRSALKRARRRDASHLSPGMFGQNSRVMRLRAIDSAGEPLNFKRMAKDFIGYETLADNALRGVVREALRRVEKEGLLANHHFYLTFKTHDPNVEIPEHLRERYPDEMTIVLQNKFWDFKVDEDKFQVTLSFQKLPATLVIPFSALTAFADPSVRFGLQFRNASPTVATAIKDGPTEIPSETAEPSQHSEAGKTASGESQVVSLDQFRKK